MIPSAGILWLSSTNHKNVLAHESHEAARLLQGAESGKNKRKNPQGYPQGSLTHSQDTTCPQPICCSRSCPLPCHRWSTWSCLGTEWLGKHEKKKVLKNAVSWKGKKNFKYSKLCLYVRVLTKINYACLDLFTVRQIKQVLQKAFFFFFLPLGLNLKYILMFSLS